MAHDHVSMLGQVPSPHAFHDIEVYTIGVFHLSVELTAGSWESTRVRDCGHVITEGSTKPVETISSRS